MKAPSIRARLQLWLLPSMVLILGAFSVFDFHRAIEPVEAAYDTALADTAFAVSARLRAVISLMEPVSRLSRSPWPEAERLRTTTQR